MSHVWPPGLLGVLDGRDLADKIGVTPQLVTVDDDGWPHIALLSAGEVVLERPDGARLALWPDSTTSANLIARRLALLAVPSTAPGGWPGCRSMRRSYSRTSTTPASVCASG